jgi:phosphotriesterase-related protein
MRVTTVLGDVSPESLGLTLSHEHLLIDLRNQFVEAEGSEDSRGSKEPLTLENVPLAHADPYAIRDNMLLDDVKLATAEIGRFSELGGGTVVDCTSVGIGRDPERLKMIAEWSGLHIVAGSGYYTQDTHPANMGERTVESIADEIVRDITEGIGETGIRAGIIGEIGTSHPIHPDEVKNLEASAQAHLQTGAAVYVHTFPWGREGIEAAKLLIERGVAPCKVVICHVDVDIDQSYMCQLLDMGVFIEFDDFGKEFSTADGDAGFAGGRFATDSERIEALLGLVQQGYEHQLLITTDICIKCALHAFGGWGYDHILSTVAPSLLARGASEAQVDILLRANPREVLARKL